MLWEDLVAFLEDGDAGVFGSNLFVGSEPASPDACVTVYEYAGPPPSFVKGGFAVRPSRVQVATRSASYAAAVAKAHSLYDLLSVSPIAPGYDAARPLQEPFADPGGKDDRGRTRVLCNYEIRRRG